jgi:hypothetical protein
MYHFYEVYEKAANRFNKITLLYPSTVLPIVCENSNINTTDITKQKF